jgi:hypothetical protein
MATKTSISEYQDAERVLAHDDARRGLLALPLRRPTRRQVTRSVMSKGHLTRSRGTHRR